MVRNSLQLREDDVDRIVHNFMKKFEEKKRCSNNIISRLNMIARCSSSEFLKTSITMAIEAHLIEGVLEGNRGSPHSH